MNKRRSMKTSLVMLLAGIITLQTIFVSASSEAYADIEKLESVSAIDENKLRLWYNAPATMWKDDGATPNTSMQLPLPIGNGYMGGMVYGSIDREHIQFNEKTLWTGGPGTGPYYNFGNKTEGANKLLPAFREHAFNYEQSAIEGMVGQMLGDTSAFGSYQNFGDLYFQFPEFDSKNVKKYVRDLDLNSGIAGVRYNYDGVNYDRKYFVSYPDNVMVMRLTANVAAKLTFDVKIDLAQSRHTKVVEGDTMKMNGYVSNNGMKFASEVKVINEGGNITTVDNNNIRVSNADAVTILLTSATDYKNDFPTYKGSDPVQKVKQTMDAASTKSYSQLLNTYTQDYKSLFERVSLDIGSLDMTIPTNELLQAYRLNSNNENARALESLMFQYGRYLLIASSREGSLPANLQGVWNHSNNPTWNSDYHTNVNLQMNYWPAMNTNIAETFLPYIDYVDSLREPGRITAREYMGVEDGGWMVNVASTPFGLTSPLDNYEWGWDTTANAWLSQALWDYYEYTQDETMLVQKIYPIMKETAEFFSKTLVEDPRDGELVVAPSYSSEHGPMTVGTTYDQEFVWQLYTDMISASKIVGETDQAFIDLLQEQLAQIDPIDIGSWGQIKEWKEEDIVPIIRPVGEAPTHRHVSNLVGLFPGRHVTKETPDYFEAAKISLEKRGYERTGWSRAKKMNMWARLQEGDKAHRMYQGIIKERTMSNLFNTHPPFQIDGSLGLTSGVAEMLLQSHAGYIQPLAALPTAWKSGSYEGLVARGNFEVGAEWSDGTLRRLTIDSNSGKKIVLRYQNINGAVITDQTGNRVNYTVDQNDQISFDTVKGASYTITPASADFTSGSGSEVLTLSDGNKDPSKDVNVIQSDRKTTIMDDLRREYYRTFGLLARDYSNESWARLDRAVADAKEFMSTDQDTTDDRVQTILTELQKARRQLEDRHQSYRVSHASRLVNKEGAWTNGNSSASTSQVGDTITYKFEGEIIEWYGVRGANRGKVKVYIDGVYDRDVDFYSTNTGNTLAYRKTDLPFGKHTIKIEVAEKSDYSSGAAVEWSEFKVFTLKDSSVPVVQNLALNKPTTANDTYTPLPGYSANQATDGKKDTRWATNDNKSEYILEIDLQATNSVNQIVIQEATDQGMGERIGDYQIEAWNKGAWHPVFSGNGVGEFRQIDIDRISAEKLRFNFKPKGTKGVTIREIEVYNIPDDSPEEPNSVLTGPAEVTSDELFTIHLGFEGLTKAILAQDIHLNYDSDIFTFISAKSVIDGVRILETIQDPSGDVRLIIVSQGIEQAVQGNPKMLELEFQVKVKDFTREITSEISVTEAILADADGLEMNANTSKIEMKIVTGDPSISEDLNGDGKVSVGDLAIVAARYDKDSTSPDWEQIKRADVNKDSRIDVADLAAVARKIME